MQDQEPASRPRSPGHLFVAFTVLALQGFGGVLAVAQRALCDQRRWLSRAEFLETLSIAQILPGPNVCNLSLMIGDRFFGLRGALAALGGMLLIPALLVLSLASVAAHVSHEPVVQGALRGVAAVTAGMAIGTALRLSGALRTSRLGAVATVLIAVAAFVAIALLRLPLLWTLLVLGGGATLHAHQRLVRSARVSPLGDRPEGARP